MFTVRRGIDVFSGRCETVRQARIVCCGVEAFASGIAPEAGGIYAKDIATIACTLQGSLCCALASPGVSPRAVRRRFERSYVFIAQVGDGRAKHATACRKPLFCPTAKRWSTPRQLPRRFALSRGATSGVAACQFCPVFFCSSQRAPRGGDEQCRLRARFFASV